jgi:hypothetical protein
MPGNANNYAHNNFKSYVGVSNNPLTKLDFTKKSNQPLYFKKYQSPYVLGNGDVSGTVWTNNSYNVAAEDPGLSWVL